MSMNQTDSNAPKVLIVLTSHDRLGGSDEKTGFWLEEFAAPYYAFIDAGVEVVMASPKEGQPPMDPKSDQADAQTEDTRRFHDDTEAQRRLASTRRLAEIDPAQFDAVFYPGGHGPLWDLATDPHSIALIRTLLESDRPVAAVCHAPAVLTEVRGSGGGYIIAGRRVTGFTNSEEEAVGLAGQVPFLLQNRLVQRGGRFGRTDDWGVHVEVDGLLVTGQNPASSRPAAEAVIRLLQQRA